MSMSYTQSEYEYAESRQETTAELFCIAILRIFLENIRSLPKTEWKRLRIFAIS